MIYSDEEQDNDDFEKFIALNKQTQNGNIREIIQQREQHHKVEQYSDQDEEDFEKFITVNLEQSKYVPQNNKRSLVNSYETPKQERTQNRSSKFEFESFILVQQSPIRKPNNEQLWELMAQHLRIQLNHLPKQYVQIRDIMVGLFDDSKVEKLLGELHDIELYGDCAKASIKVIIFFMSEDSNGECKISIPADIFQEDEFKQKNSNPNPKVTNILVEIPRMDGIVVYAENVTVARLGDDRFLILGRNNLKLVSY